MPVLRRDRNDRRGVKGGGSSERPTPPWVRSAPGSGPSGASRTGLLSANSGLMQRRKKNSLFNHLVHTHEHRHRHLESKRFRSLEVDDEFDLHGLLHR
jgi:hypothetical protein